jgi:hypothetical protein
MHAQRQVPDSSFPTEISSRKRRNGIACCKTAQTGPGFFPLRATNLKHSRRWLTLVTGETLQDADKHPWKPPLFWRSWRLRVVDDSNERGDWMTFRPEKGATTLELDPSRRLIRVCMDFYEGVRTKAARGDLGADDGD